jgi:hypothetical protein
MLRHSVPISSTLQTKWHMSQGAQQPRWSRVTLDRIVRKDQIVKSSAPTRFSISVTPRISPSLHVTYTALSVYERPQVDMRSCEANSSGRCITQEV